MPSSNVDDTVKCKHSLPCRHQMWMTLSSADTACHAVIKCGWHCQVQKQLAMPSSNADDTVKCRHSLLCHHQMHMTPSSGDTACHAIIKCGWHRQGQTQLAVPSLYAVDTVKGRHSLPCHHQMRMTPSRADTACRAIIKCGWHWQVQTVSLPCLQCGTIYNITCDIDSSYTYIGETKRTLSQRFKEHTNLDKPTGVGDYCRATGQNWPVNPTAGTREKWRSLHISNREPLPWTETRDTICLPFTTKLSRQNVNQHTWHLYVNKARSWRVETSCTSSTIMLQSKLNYTTICLSVCHITWRTVRWLFHPAHFSNMKHAQWP